MQLIDPIIARTLVPSPAMASAGAPAAHAPAPAAAADEPAAGDLPRHPVRGWTPTDVTAWESVRRSSVLGTLDAARGVREEHPGQALSDAQRAVLGGFLSREYGLPEETVARDLERVRMYVGGPGGGGGFGGIALGHEIYLANEQTLERILSWQGRRFLAHELGHVMQWRASRDGEEPGDDLRRTRRFLGNYVAGFVVDDRWRPGAVPRGMTRWVAARLPGTERDRRPLMREIHGAHHMEVRAEQVAQRFRAGTMPQRPATDAARGALEVTPGTNPQRQEQGQGRSAGAAG